MRNPSQLFVALLSFVLVAGCHDNTDVEWNITPSLTCDAFYFLHALSDETFHNRLYPRDRDLWNTRLGPQALDSIQAIHEEMSGLGFKACYLLAYRGAIPSLHDLIPLLEDWDRFDHHTREALVAADDYRKEAAFNDLDAIAGVRDKVLFVFRRMQEERWDDDWAAVSQRLQYDIERIHSQLQDYSPAVLRVEVDRFLGHPVAPPDSLNTVYYLYYAYPQGFKLPFGMMGTWSIQEPDYFISGFLHEALHDFSIYQPELLDLHNQLLDASPLFREDRDVLVERFFQSDDEFYILAAEAYLSVRLGIRTNVEAEQYLRTTNGGAALYSLMLYEQLRDRFVGDDDTFEEFLIDIFFIETSGESVERWLRENRPNI